MVATAPTRRQLAQRLRDLARLRRDQAAFEHGLVRGRCANRRCQSRFAIVRVLYDLRNPKEKLVSADLMCASCDRVWSRTAVPDLSEHRNVQRHRITLYLPPKHKERTFVLRGKVHREGDDALVLEHTTYMQLTESLAEWRVRNDRHGKAAFLRAQARKAEREAEAAEFVAHEMADDGWLERYKAAHEAVAVFS